MIHFEQRSQAAQDYFVYSVFKKHGDLQIGRGQFLELGSEHPIENNNTYELETKLGWGGVLVEIDPQWEEGYKKHRTSPYIIGDSTKIDWITQLSELGYPAGTVFDYLSLDIDSATLETMRNFPFDKYEFKLITGEHDLWREPPTKKFEMAKTFMGLGYKYICENVKNLGNPYEEWWYNPKYIDENLIQSLRSTNEEWTEIKKRMLAL